MHIDKQLVAWSSKNCRFIHTTCSRSFPRKQYEVGTPPPPQLRKTGLLLDEDIDIDNSPDIHQDTALGHYILDEERDVLHYMRLIEHDVPKLVSWRKSFQPPENCPLIIRTTSRGGEVHRSTEKRTIVAPVLRLGLKSDEAVHNIKLLSGSHWTLLPPKNAGVASSDSDGEHGYIKIACDNFPHPGMNLKWAGDVLDRLIRKAHAVKGIFSTLPLDTRHIDAPLAKYKHRRQDRPSIRDFPKSWLPQHNEKEPELTATQT